MIPKEIIRDVAYRTMRKHAASPLTSTLEFWERIATTILEEYEKTMEKPMPGTKPIVLDRQTVLRICNALNAEAAHFEAQVDGGNHLPPSTREVLLYSARSNRALTRNLLEQWDKV